MPAPNLKQRDPLDDFERRDVTLLGQTKRVFVAGRGPAVIVMTEMPGISPARRALRALRARRGLHGLDAEPVRRPGRVPSRSAAAR